MSTPQPSALIKVADVHNWNEDQIEQFLKFCDVFYEGEKITVNAGSVAIAETYRNEYPLFGDLLDRAGTGITEKNFDKNRQKFVMRISTIIRTFKNAVMAKPNLITPKMVVENFGKTHFQWMQKSYGSNGIPKDVPAVILQSTKDLGINVETVHAEITPSVRLQRASEKVIHIYDMLADSIDLKDIEKLSVKDRLTYLQKLSFVQTSKAKQKTNINFIKTNTKTGSKEELESALLDFTQDNEEE